MPSFMDNTERISSMPSLVMANCMVNARVIRALVHNVKYCPRRMSELVTDINGTIAIYSILPCVLFFKPSGLRGVHSAAAEWKSRLGYEESLIFEERMMMTHSFYCWLIFN